MKYRAVIKKTNDWWIGWLVDLPGVNAQERTREQVVESLRVGAHTVPASFGKKCWRQRFRLRRKG